MLDLATAHRLVQEIVAEQGPDFIYNKDRSNGSCFYVPAPQVFKWIEDGRINRSNLAVAGLFTETYDPEHDVRRTTACLVGRVLEAAGETRHQEADSLSRAVSALAVAFPDMMTPGATSYLTVVQIAQDDGETWGTAASEGDKCIEEQGWLSAIQ